jgi:hypothetical protein
MPHRPLATSANPQRAPLVVYRDTISMFFGEYCFLTSEHTDAEIAAYLNACKRISELGVPGVGTVPLPEIDELNVPVGTIFANLSDVLGGITIS